MLKKRIICVFGTRPEAIKMAPVILELKKRARYDLFVAVTAQHRAMLDSVLEAFNIEPDYDLNIMTENQTLGGITSSVLTGMAALFKAQKPDICLVHGDTTTTFAASLAAFYAQIPIGHVEAGLRTFDLSQPYPEEANRKLTGALASLHFAPTISAKENLLKENVRNETIFVTGNTGIDTLSYTARENYRFKNETLRTLDFSKKTVLLTAHRRENFGAPLLSVFAAVKRLLAKNPDAQTVYPVHLNPSVRGCAFSELENTPRVFLTEPLDIVDMHNLLARSYIVLTDSGGLQEEGPALDKPVLTLRNVTERPEGVTSCALKLVGTDEQSVFTAADKLLNDAASYEQMARAKNPFGDGKASQRIIGGLDFYFGFEQKRPEDF